jgi:hypothetical protein
MKTKITKWASSALFLSAFVFLLAILAVQYILHSHTELCGDVYCIKSNYALIRLDEFWHLNKFWFWSADLILWIVILAQFIWRRFLKRNL